MRVGVVLGHPLGDARDGGVHLGAAQLLVGGDLAGRGLQQRRAGQEDLGLVAHHDDVVGEAGQIGAARGRRAVHDGDLRDAARRHARLVGEAAAARHEDLGLVAAGWRRPIRPGSPPAACSPCTICCTRWPLRWPDGATVPPLMALFDGRDDAAHALDIADARDRAAARRSSRPCRRACGSRRAASARGTARRGRAAARCARAASAACALAKRARDFSDAACTLASAARNSAMAASMPSRLRL